jgi:K+-sensing histidine kinase KdpD
VIKQNTVRYESFYKSLPLLTSSNSKSDDADSDLNKHNFYPAVIKEKQFFEELVHLQNDLSALTNLIDISERFSEALRKVIPLKESDILLLDEAKLSFIPIVPGERVKAVNFVNKSYKEGILDWIFETRFSKVIPDFKQYNINGAKLFYIIFPIISENVNKGVLTILSSLNSLSEESVENKVIRLMLDLTYARIELIRHKKELAHVYQDQQAYQSKLLNDYKLSAIGELTSGVVEDILTPLQVILSQVDMVNKDRGRLNEKSTLIIKNQISKVQSIIQRLVKFASFNQNSPKIQPCNMNKMIEDFYNMLSSTLKNNGFECDLDLMEDLPLVLSHSNYINQLLSNIFSIINSSGAGSGGILIQTRYRAEKITVRFVTTNIIEAIKNKNDVSQFNLRIINNIMKKHEGELKIGITEENGTIILLSFPLKRKIMK